MTEGLFPAPYIGLPKYFQVAWSGIHRHFFLPLGSRAILPNELLPYRFGNQLAVIGDAVELRTIVHAEAVGMHVRGHHAERFPIDFFHHVRAQGSRHLGFAQHRHIIGNFSGGKLGQDSLPFPRTSHPLILDLEKRVAGLKYFYEFLCPGFAPSSHLTVSPTLIRPSFFAPSTSFSRPWAQRGARDDKNNAPISAPMKLLIFIGHLSRPAYSSLNAIRRFSWSRS